MEKTNPFIWFNAHDNIEPAYTEFFVESVTDIKGLSRDNWFTKDEYIKTVMGEVEKMGKYF